MKRITLGLLGIITLLSCQDVFAGRWAVVYKDQIEKVAIDKSSIKYINGINSFWWKDESDYEKLLDAKTAKLYSTAMFFVSVNCNKQNWRFKEIEYYNLAGMHVDGSQFADDKNNPWRSIIPDSNIDRVSRYICKNH